MYGKALLGTAIAQCLRFAKAYERSKAGPYAQQMNLLKYQLYVAQDTEFGRLYGFKSLLKEWPTIHTKETLVTVQRAFANQVPCFTYEEMYRAWWYRLDTGVANLCWPNRITRVAISSGTSKDGAVKYIPVTDEMLRSMIKFCRRVLYSTTEYVRDNTAFTSSCVTLGSSTRLKEIGPHMYGRDISGFMNSNRNFITRFCVKPNYAIRQLDDWEDRVSAIVKQALAWNVSRIAGSPMWVQFVLRRIIEVHRLDSIHDIWPNLQYFFHGGVFLDSYKNIFTTLAARGLTYINIYSASEGCMAYQTDPHTQSMRLALDAGVFYEFVPFESMQDSVVQNTQAINIADVELNKPYVLIISTLAGLWRYIIKDVVVFRSLEPFEIIIQGRMTFHLNLCGEHVSMYDMQTILLSVTKKLHLLVEEFTVFGARKNNEFVHVWHLGIVERVQLSEEDCATALDKELQALNVDYRLYRKTHLRQIQVKFIPNHYFYDWMRMRGKLGGQNKFPQVLQGKLLKNWLEHTLPMSVTFDSDQSGGVPIMD